MLVALDLFIFFADFADSLCAAAAAAAVAVIFLLLLRARHHMKALWTLAKPNPLTEVLVAETQVLATLALVLVTLVLVGGWLKRWCLMPKHSHAKAFTLLFPRCPTRHCPSKLPAPALASRPVRRPRVAPMAIFLLLQLPMNVDTTFTALEPGPIRQ